MWPTTTIDHITKESRMSISFPMCFKGGIWWKLERRTACTNTVQTLSSCLITDTCMILRGEAKNRVRWWKSESIFMVYLLVSFFLDLSCDKFIMHAQDKWDKPEKKMVSKQTFVLELWITLIRLGHYWKRKVRDIIIWWISKPKLRHCDWPRAKGKNQRIKYQPIVPDFPGFRYSVRIPPYDNGAMIFKEFGSFISTINSLDKKWTLFCHFLCEFTLLPFFIRTINCRDGWSRCKPSHHLHREILTEDLNPTFTAKHSGWVLLSLT